MLTAVDDCWGVRDEATGKIEGDKTRFPEGMQAFIAKIHALGFRFGLCMRLSNKNHMSRFPCMHACPWTAA